ncbi:atypical/ABC1/ABC1-B protein kinase [Coprinopsis cinerea okayama7|uniref:Atypical/ABC1/ABC1-B protein kinase n=1 Tax=Coprinopsis cinerea (strain Okayama-7 / 130 / ATCC MYA-4618 / FGSC 9003) TaxID=240176 RepID=D6RL74_COPC7|nr:atypical/ABC1/ABC1-B protein kinase [Coprinopsis cinerea okayama7\|eukprot:XP_002911640.1 atypical/ABC1/ABC1-B protein kinase [Coprinopsis cinerea okayama7\
MFKNGRLLQWFHSTSILRKSALSNTNTTTSRRWEQLGRRGFRSRHHTPNSSSSTATRKWRQPYIFYPACAVVLGAAGVTAYKTHKGFRHTVLAVVRCSRIADAAIRGAIDYKVMMSKSYGSDEEVNRAWSECHTRSAKRVLKALLANGGVFIKMGQHMATLVVLPVEWTSTMRPLQDQCEPTSYEELEGLFKQDMGVEVNELFEDFDPNPVGVASLAQVHVARHKPTGRRVAVKLQHPHLAEFCDIDVEMVDVTLGWIKYWFPEFEFTWLGDEMRTNLPKEMDFVHEAENAERTKRDFAHVKTSLYIPEVIHAAKRVLIMEFIEGGRVDDLEYLARHNIDRNKVAVELSRIFSEMVFHNGWFHADPHPGNLLIRPSPPSSKSPYNFEIALLDHGLYFDLDDELRVNYSRLWLSLISAASPTVIAERKRLAQLVGNVGPDLYPIFEAALTGRAALEGSFEDGKDVSFKRGSSMIDTTSRAEIEAVRHAVANTDGLILSVFDVLRRVPRRILMVLKLNDLTRGLDRALATTHSNVRVFLVHAKYCLKASWVADQHQILSNVRTFGFTRSLCLWISGWWHYRTSYAAFAVYEALLDFQGWKVKKLAWLRGLWRQGFRGAHDAAAGLRIEA